MAMTPAPRALAELLDSAVPQLRERLVEERIRRAWPGLVGPDVARRARPQVLNAEILVVVVDNSPWLQELTLRAAELTARVTAAFPVVRSVRFVLGRLPGEVAPSTRTPEAPSTVLSEAESREIDLAVETIADPVLAHSARRLLSSAWRASRPRGDLR